MTGTQWVGAVLILVGVASEVAAIVAAWQANARAKEWIAKAGDHAPSLRGDVSEVLKALITKLPWIAVMALVTIVLGMVLLMNRWPWQSAC